MPPKKPLPPADVHLPPIAPQVPTGPRHTPTPPSPRRSSISPSEEIEVSEATLLAENEVYNDKMERIAARKPSDYNIEEKKTRHPIPRSSHTRLHFGRQHVKEFDVLTEPTVVQGLESTQSEPFEGSYALTKAERFITALENCLSSQDTFESFYAACVHFLKTKKPNFNEVDLTNKQVLKYVLDCAKSIHLNFDEDRAYKKQVTKIILDVLSKAEPLKAKYIELDYEREIAELDAEQAKLDAELAALNAEKSSDETPQPSNPPSPQPGPGSATALAKLSQGEGAAPEPRPAETAAKKPAMTVAGQMLEKLRPGSTEAAREEPSTNHTPRVPGK